MIKSLKIGLLFLMMVCSALAEQRVIYVRSTYYNDAPDLSSVNALLHKGWRIVNVAVGGDYRTTIIFVLESPAPTKP